MKVNTIMTILLVSILLIGNIYLLIKINAVNKQHQVVLRTITQKMQNRIDSLVTQIQNKQKQISDIQSGVKELKSKISSIPQYQNLTESQINSYVDMIIRKYYEDFNKPAK